MKNQFKTFKELYEYCATLTDNEEVLLSVRIKIVCFLQSQIYSLSFYQASLEAYIQCLIDCFSGLSLDDCTKIFGCVCDITRSFRRDRNVCPEDVEFFKLVTPSASELATADK